MLTKNESIVDIEEGQLNIKLEFEIDEKTRSEEKVKSLGWTMGVAQTVYSELMKEAELITVTDSKQMVREVAALSQRIAKKHFPKNLPPQLTFTLNVEQSVYDLNIHILV